MTAVAPPFTYAGGKTTLARRIVALLPAHKSYIEPFAGGLSVLLAKQPVKLETINDLDGAIVTFWRVLRDRPEEFMRVCALTPHARGELEAANSLSPDIGELELARRVWVRLTQGRAGTLRPTGWRHYQDPNGTTVSMPGYLSGYLSRMPRAVTRLASVSLECRPALDVIARYGRHPESLIYADPPYLRGTRAPGRYRHEMAGEAEHRELAEALRACRAAVVLCGYASPLYDETLYADWYRVELPAWTGHWVRSAVALRCCGPTDAWPRKANCSMTTAVRRAWVRRSPGSAHEVCACEAERVQVVAARRTTSLAQ